MASKSEGKGSVTERIIRMEEVKGSVVEVVESSEESKGSGQESKGSGQESVGSTGESKRSRKKTLTPAEQDQVIANFTEDSKRKIKLVKETPELLVLMSQRGMKLAKLEEGEALQQALEASFAARQAAIGMGNGTQGVMDTARNEAYDALIDFREIVRAFFRTATDQKTLGIMGTVPKDIDKLILSARTSYTNAAQEPYKTVLADCGYDDEGLAAAEATLTTLESARTARDAATAAGVNATATRNTDYAALVVWMESFDRIAKVALRKRPDLLARL